MQSTRRHLFKLAGGAALLSGLSAVQAAVPRSSIEKFDEQYDVVIVGSGFAGLTCALRCAEKNYSVLLIEKMTILGGNSLICGGTLPVRATPIKRSSGSRIPVKSLSATAPETALESTMSNCSMSSMTAATMSWRSCANTAAR